MNKWLMVFFVISSLVPAQDKRNVKDGEQKPDPVLLVKEKEKKEVKDGEMKQYFLVLLKRGPIRNHDSTTSAKIQEAHLANITRLYNEGKIDIAGPFGHDGDLRGIFIFNCETYDEVLALCTTDPAIKAGRLVAEIYPWWSAKGSKLR